MHRRIAPLLLACAAFASQAAELTVSAAASLANAFRDLASMFESANPGTRLQLNVAASGVLLQQILKGAPVDVFASADHETMDRAQEQGRIRAAQRRDFASNALVLVVPAAAGSIPKAIDDLARPAYQRIAIGLPASVPAGRYAQAALQASGHWQAVEAKTIGAQSVRQALDYVARGEVDAGFVYATDAALMPGKVKVALTLHTATPVRYPVAPVADAPNAALAQRFVDFLLAPPAQAVLARHGFGPPR